MRSERGFTLLELLVSLAIAAILVMTQVAPFQQTILSRDRTERAMEQTSAVRLTLQRLVEEVSGSLLLPGEGGAFRVVDRSLDQPSSELSFATSNAQRVQGGARDPVQIVHYFLEPAPLVDSLAGGSRRLRLIKEQLPSVAAPGVEPTRLRVLDDVLRFRVRVVPPGSDQWVETWPGEGGSGALPRAVELELAVADGTRAPTVYRIAVPLPLGASS